MQHYKGELKLNIQLGPSYPGQYKFSLLLLKYCYYLHKNISSFLHFLYSFLIIIKLLHIGLYSQV